MTKIELAKLVRIEEIFRNYGVQVTPRRNAVAFWRGDTKPSVRINDGGTLWYDHGTGDGGDVVHLVSVIEKCPAIEAAERILALNIESRPFSFTASTPQPVKSRTEIVSIKPIWSYPLKNYLQKRCIPAEIYNRYCKEIVYRVAGCDKNLFAIGFATSNGGWVLRQGNEGPYSKSCSKAGITHIKNECNCVRIYEGFMDFLSYIAEYPGLAELDDYIILNSVANVDKALPLLNDYEYIECYTDGDAAGYAAGEALMEHWEILGKERSAFGFHSPALYGTDVNGMWMKKCKQTKNRIA